MKSTCIAVFVLALCACAAREINCAQVLQPINAPRPAMHELQSQPLPHRGEHK